jgi:amidase
MSVVRATAQKCNRLLLVVAVVAAAASAFSAQAPQRVASFDLEEVTIAELQQRMATGRETSRSIVEKYLARIDEIDRRGPELHSVLELNPDARSIADAMDAERRAGHLRGPLHGIPVLIKDNIATADRMLTTAGSLALAGAPAPGDAFIVERLRASGAVILGKTNLSEWANFRSTHSSSGWSGRGGQTKNPYALDRTPSGSSSGSGAAAAANLAAIAVGTETDGSIVSPSHMNSLVGIKPTLGLVSRSGIVPIAHSQDTAGPMARTVGDAAILLGVLAGSDPRDAASARADARGRRDYSRSLVRDGLRGARIGVVRNRLFGYSALTDALAEEAIADMKREGAVIVDPANIPTLGKFDESEFDVLQYEFKADLNTYLASLRPAAGVHSLMDVIAFNEAQKRRTALLRPGNHGDGAEKGAVDRCEVPGAAREQPAIRRCAGHRRHDEDVSSGCARRADRRPGVAHRSGQRRRRHGHGSRAFDGHVSCGIPAYHRPDGFRSRSAGRDLVLRPRVE